MEYIEYHYAQAFLNTTQPVFEKNETLFGLMLGISLRLVENPLHYGTQPYLATISDKKNLQLIALMTPPHKLQIASFSSDSTNAIALLATHLQKGNWNVPAVLAEEEIAIKFESEWKMLSGCQSEHGMRQRIYKLRSVKHHDYPSGYIRQATIADLSRIAAWYAAFQGDCFGGSIHGECTKATQIMIENGDLYIWEDSLPVSMAGFARPTKNGISVSYVYTPPEFRKKGYASALVASLSKLALENGKKFCTLYTDLGNPTSNSIYQKIGYDAVADVMDVNFTKKDSIA
ncbi:MAG: GNAT family N-acetyltransferase [Candidatus Riflebacteria bacterium]|nr:GNAT family N-acetyltransferase [Candidatus Riflebacteria bacterium]